ncbi:NAD(P)H-dependent oxidoreductase [Actinomycetospora endophytica]|uniref:NAD(P)H-dependent oxidoreductase n=1 Tax=Actinomycetospora endophytica TaxID=2291215 RepID=A0ABS8PFW6_9PSEU|nr:NAD(P)H-dependent oxidoreductase [Actinomycetospora endophytica]MCD2196888.1 NAD(P)H-dependent oxidoreductase [Actinomycetospora endophytica]
MSVSSDHPARPRLLGLVGSPSPGGRSLTAVRALLAGAAAEGAEVEVLELADGPDPEKIQQAFEVADGIAFATPTYRARSSSLIKAVLENTERGIVGDTRSPLLGKAAAIVHTGATAHHFLAVDDLRDVLAGFFAAQVLAPGLYFEGADYDEPTVLGESAQQLAEAHGRAFAQFTAGVRAAPAVRALKPLL